MRAPRCSAEGPGVFAPCRECCLRGGSVPAGRPLSRHIVTPHDCASFQSMGSPSEAASEGPRPEDTPKPSAGVGGIQTSWPEGYGNHLMCCRPRDQGQEALKHPVATAGSAGPPPPPGRRVWLHHGVCSVGSRHPTSSHPGMYLLPRHIPPQVFAKALPSHAASPSVRRLRAVLRGGPPGPHSV